MPVTLHVGWSARDGRLLTRLDGALWCADWMHPSRERSTSSGIEFTVDALKGVDHVREQAGLFAWRETDEIVRAWDTQRLGRVLDQALATMSVISESRAATFNQLALYDPESEEWHFVDREAARLSAQRAFPGFRFPG